MNQSGAQTHTQQEKLKERELQLLGKDPGDEDDDEELQEYRGSKDWGMALRLREKNQQILPQNISDLEYLAPINPALEALEHAFHAIPFEDDAAYRIIFPWDEHYKCFIMDETHRTLALDSVTHDEIVLVFDSLRKSKYYDFYTNMHLKLSIPFFVLIVLSLCIYFAFQDTIHGSVTIAVTCILVLLFLLGATGITLTKYWAIFLQERFNSRETDFNKILEELNQNKFRARGLSWKAGPFGTYIELRFEFLTEQDF